jgi:hypothetical protein
MSGGQSPSACSAKALRHPRTAFGCCAPRGGESENGHRTELACDSARSVKPPRLGWIPPTGRHGSRRLRRRVCGVLSLMFDRARDRSHKPQRLGCGGLTPSHLWLGSSRRFSFLLLLYCLWENPVPIPVGQNFVALGLQSYSRLLYLSRGKHYRLYLQQ